MDRQCTGMDGETICRDTGTGTQPQQMEETAAQLVRTASRRLHGELKEPSGSVSFWLVICSANGPFS